ncbi:hypothetical protein L931_01700 [Helicobacter pylori PZ5024]|uniref:Uncharacterized protein n=1 Tax=Helicobacter pylori PZ5024 TaxID=1337391 RepID=T2T4P6_HELPX|nr:hypothetical protein L930_04070 [Helicobacter pylori PZ5004]EQD99540.1 hypothetical protein L931_01700 [Helicobacter pylori PZ5024]
MFVFLMKKVSDYKEIKKLFLNHFKKFLLYSLKKHSKNYFHLI